MRLETVVGIALGKGLLPSTDGCLFFFPLLAGAGGAFFAFGTGTGCAIGIVGMAFGRWRNRCQSLGHGGGDCQRRDPQPSPLAMAEGTANGAVHDHDSEKMPASALVAVPGICCQRPPCVYAFLPCLRSLLFPPACGGEGGDSFSFEAMCWKKLLSAGQDVFPVVLRHRRCHPSTAQGAPPPEGPGAPWVHAPTNVPRRGTPTLETCLRRSPQPRYRSIGRVRAIAPAIIICAHRLLCVLFVLCGYSSQPPRQNCAVGTGIC